jgi:hypothetical protein
MLINARDTETPLLRKQRVRVTGPPLLRDHDDSAALDGR